MDDPQLLMEIGRMDDQEIVNAMTQLRQERERLRAALGFYAEPDNYDRLNMLIEGRVVPSSCVEQDRGNRARTVLDGGKE